MYDIKNYPDWLRNLIASPEHQTKLGILRGRLQQWMVDTQDGMLPVFQQREDAAAREAYMVAQEEQAEARKNNREKKKANKKSKAVKGAAAKGAAAKAK